MTVMQFVLALLAIAAGLSLAMSLGWVAEQTTGNSGWIDTTWTFGLGVVGCAGAFTPSLSTGGMMIRQVLVAVLVAVRSLRLGLHIARRRFETKRG